MKKIAQYIWKALIVLAVWVLSVLVLENLFDIRDNKEVLLGSVAIAIIVIFLFKTFKK